MSTNSDKSGLTADDILRHYDCGGKKRPNIMWNMRTHGNGCVAMFQNIKIKYEKIFRRRLYASYCFKVITV